MPGTYIRLLIILMLAVLSTPLMAAGDPYATDLLSAASFVEQGNYDKAVNSANSALARRANDAYSHLMLGTIFLHTHQVDKAFKEFSSANSLSKDNQLASYGFAVYYFEKGDYNTAKKYVERAQHNGYYDVTPTLNYISVLSGSFPEDAGAMTDPVAAQIEAQRLYKAQKYNEAFLLLKTIVAEHKGFAEQAGTVITFDPANPVDSTGRALSKPYKVPTESEPGLRKFSGSVVLKAGLKNTQGIAYVLFYIDNSLLGMVNTSPYECRWDTEKYSNAPHTVKIQGIGQSSELLSEKTIRIIVSNGTSPGGDPLPMEDVKQIEEKLWHSLQLKPSYKLAFYTMAKCADAKGDRSAATAALEHIVAIDPNFKDARNLLIQHYSPIPKYQAFWQVKTGEKVAAITFDDGPNPKTAKILDILASKGVKATFFVVGQMAEANPDMMKRMVEEGHELEMHTYSHKNLQYISDLDIEKELVRDAVVIRDLTGKPVHFFRPPGGHHSNNLGSTAGKYGYRSVFWTINCSKNEGTKRDNIISQVSSKACPGCIVLMHNVENVTLQALPKVIDTLKAKGYKLVTLSEMVGRN